VHRREQRRRTAFTYRSIHEVTPESVRRTARTLTCRGDRVDVWHSLSPDPAQPEPPSDYFFVRLAWGNASCWVALTDGSLSVDGCSNSVHV
jgi:hypothetical protein